MLTRSRAKKVEHVKPPATKKLNTAEKNKLVAEMQSVRAPSPHQQQSNKRGRKKGGKKAPKAEKSAVKEKIRPEARDRVQTPVIKRQPQSVVTSGIKFVPKIVIDVPRDIVQPPAFQYLMHEKAETLMWNMVENCFNEAEKLAVYLDNLQPSLMKVGTRASVFNLPKTPRVKTARKRENFFTPSAAKHKNPRFFSPIAMHTYNKLVNSARKLPEKIHQTGDKETASKLQRKQELSTVAEKDDTRTIKINNRRSSGFFKANTIRYSQAKLREMCSRRQEPTEDDGDWVDVPKVNKANEEKKTSVPVEVDEEIVADAVLGIDELDEGDTQRAKMSLPKAMIEKNKTADKNDKNMLNAMGQIQDVVMKSATKSAAPKSGRKEIFGDVDTVMESAKKPLQKVLSENIGGKVLYSEAKSKYLVEKSPQPAANEPLTQNPIASDNLNKTFRIDRDSTKITTTPGNKKNIAEEIMVLSDKMKGEKFSASPTSDSDIEVIQESYAIKNSNLKPSAAKASESKNFNQVSTPIENTKYYSLVSTVAAEHGKSTERQFSEADRPSPQIPGPSKNLEASASNTQQRSVDMMANNDGLTEHIEELKKIERVVSPIKPDKEIAASPPQRAKTVVKDVNYMQQSPLSSFKQFAATSQSATPGTDHIHRLLDWKKQLSAQRKAQKRKETPVSACKNVFAQQSDWIDVSYPRGSPSINRTNLKEERKAIKSGMKNSAPKDTTTSDRAPSPTPVVKRNGPKILKAPPSEPKIVKPKKPEITAQDLISKTAKAVENKQNNLLMLAEKKKREREERERKVQQNRKLLQATNASSRSGWGADGKGSSRKVIVKSGNKLTQNISKSVTLKPAKEVLSATPMKVLPKFHNQKLALVSKTAKLTNTQTPKHAHAEKAVANEKMVGKAASSGMTSQKIPQIMMPPPASPAKKSIFDLDSSQMLTAEQFNSTNHLSMSNLKKGFGHDSMYSPESTKLESPKAHQKLNIATSSNSYTGSVLAAATEKTYPGFGSTASSSSKLSQSNADCKTPGFSKTSIWKSTIELLKAIYLYISSIIKKPLMTLPSDEDFPEWAIPKWAQREQLNITTRRMHSANYNLSRLFSEAMPTTFHETDIFRDSVSRRPRQSSGDWSHIPYPELGSVDFASDY